jgi:hypothetical protein
MNFMSLISEVFKKIINLDNYIKHDLWVKMYTLCRVSKNNQLAVLMV